MIWLTSDEHYGHANIIRYCQRPFADVEEMNAELIRRHNAVVGPDDDVYHLGDFALREPLVPIVLKQLVGKHHLICGNHDAPWRGKSGAEKAMKRYMRHGFVSVAQAGVIGGVKAEHKPFPPTDQWLFHGHVHEKWLFNGRQINVGVDQWGFYPVSLDTLQKLFLF